MGLPVTFPSDGAPGILALQASHQLLREGDNYPLSEAMRARITRNHPQDLTHRCSINIYYHLQKHFSLWLIN